MRRLPIALGIALVVVAAAVAYVTVAPKATNNVIYINVTKVPSNTTLPALPRDTIVVSFAPNITGYWCVYVDIPGGVAVDRYSGIVHRDTISLSCFTGGQTVRIYFNESAPPWDFLYEVVKSPKYVVVRITPMG